MHYATGSLIGVGVGEALIQVAAHEVTPSWAEWIVRVVGLVAAAVVVRYVLQKAALRTDRLTPRAGVLRNYLIVVVLAVIALPAGIWVFLNVLPIHELILPWVVMVVGLQFIPSAPALHAEAFDRMGAIVFLAGMAGGAFTLYFQPVIGAWSAVAAGLVVLGYAAASALGPARLRRTLP